MKLWPPWGKKPEPELRSTSVGYTASLTAALEAGAEGLVSGAPLAVAALEAAAGLYARCMSAAVVKGGGRAAEALTPPVLALMARNLIRRGEDFHRVYVRRGMVVLEPIGFAYAHGAGPDPLSWTYNVTLYGPTDSRHEWTPATALLHSRYAVDASRPWLGVPPWSWAYTTGSAIAAVETLLRDQARSPHGHLLSVPESPQPGEDEDVRPLDAFRSDVAAAKGATLIAESPDKWDEANSMRGSASSSFAVTRFGMDPQDAIVLRTQTGQDILSACGVPPTLFVANSDGTAQREAFRRFLHSSLKPMARLIETEARSKLDAPGLTLDLSEIHAADVAGRARSFKAFVEAGVHPEDAALNTGVVLERPMRPAQKKGVADGGS